MSALRHISAVVLVITSLVAAGRCQDAAPAAAEGPAKKDAAETSLAPENVRQLMQDRDYAGAVGAIDAALAKPDAAQPYLGYLKGRALHLDGQYDAAIKVLLETARKHEHSKWARRARFAAAVAHARKGDFRAAELIYRAEAEHLLSSERKQEIADIYLEFADVYFKPKKESEKPNYAQALEFYRQALEVGPQNEKRIEIELLVARCQQHLGKHAEAIKLLQKFIDEHEDDKHAVEARYRLGESQLASGDKVAARRSWQDLLSQHEDAKSERLAEAMYKIALTYNIPQPEDKEQLSLGVAALKAFIKKHPEHKLASQAHLMIARSYRHRNRVEDAVAALKTFLADKRYSKTDAAPEARNLLGQAYLLQKNFDQALAAWREYLSNHATHKAWSQVQRAIIDAEYARAAEQFNEKHYDEARKLWNEFLVKYPLDGRGRQILVKFGRMHYAQEQWDEAIAEWRRLVSKYPRTAEASEAQFLIAETLEVHLVKLEEALKEYRKLDWGNFVAPARQRAARLTAKQMAIRTERVFRSNETPTLKLTSRNIEEVTVRIYTVDLETYFRKMHLARGVESLDISLIDPDHSFTFKLPDYEKYAETERDVEVPLPAGDDAAKSTAGVMAVTVSSKTLEATTLVLQSDLDVIVKSSRDEVLVLAQNMLTGKAWPGVRLLLSNGEQVFAEETTGEDGVLKQSFDQLKSAGDVRVFAVTAGNVASNVVNLSGVGVARGLTSKGYVYTDRPAYRSGQIVHVRGVIRKVDGDVYTVEKDKKYQLDVFDNRNRLVHGEEVTLGEFGSFHDHFTLPSASPQGQYRMVVRDKDEKENYQGLFVVHQYQLEPVRIEVDTPRAVYYRGEEIEGKIKVSFYYGAPVAGREVRYQLAGGRIETAKTDGNGEIDIKLSTRDFRETQALPLSVVLPERNLRGGKTFLLATQGFSIQATTVRPVYLSGDTFELTVKTIDAEGKPAAQPLALSVLEKTNVGGKVGERLVEKHELKTDEKEGTARKTLRLEEGGRYVLRVTGTDRFENSITGERLVKISDEDDTVRLRILADKHTYKVGDTASVQLHWREDPALALVTHQGAKILDYQLVRLKKGANKLDIPMTAKLAPNFELAVAVMTDARPEKKKATDEDQQPPRRFHAAASPFQVQRDLKVSVAIKSKGGAKKPARPGEDVEVIVTTTDPQGKPVAAEVSLALVEQAILSRFSSPLPSIGDYFRAASRQSAMRTTSSVTFAYSPPTRGINTRLLAEEDRLAIVEEETRLLEHLRSAENILRSGISPDTWDEVAGQPGDAAPDPASVANASDPFGGAGPGNGDNGRRSQSGRQVDEAGNVVTDERALGYTLLGQQTIQGFSGNLNANGHAGFGFGGVAQGQTWAQSLSQTEGSFVPMPDELPITYPDAEAWERLVQNKRPQANVSNSSVLVESYYKQLAQHDAPEVQVMAGGTLYSLNFNNALGRQWKAEDARKLVEGLHKQGAVLLANLPPQETGYWNPSVVTGKDGTAKLTVTLPERSTAWKLLAKGVTTDTLSGEASDELAVKKDLFGQLKLPAAFTDGDQAQVIASVHNDLIEKGKIEVTLKTTIGETSTTETKTLDAAKKGIAELAFESKVDLFGEAVKSGAAYAEVTFELTITAGETKDVIRRTVPVKPYGMPVFAVAGGTSTSDTTAVIDPPAGMPLSARRLQVLLGPTVEQSLLDVILSPGPACQIECCRIASGSDRAVSDLMAAIALQRLVGATRDADSPQAAALDARIRSSVSLLVSMQNDDGGWSWSGRGGGSNRYNSARSTWALALAKEAGYRVSDETLKKATVFLQTQVTQTRVTDYETKSILLHALAVVGEEDFPLANQLYRNRPSLTTAGLVYLTLAFAEMDRKQTAGELLSMLAKRKLHEDAPKRKVSGNSLPWAHAPAELRALYALALDKISPSDGKLKEQVDWLMAHRTGYRWSPEKATGPAMLALSGWFARSRFKGEKYTLTVYVNNLLAKKIEVDDETLTQTIDIPAELLDKKPQQRVRFEITGRGRFSYQCVLSGFVPADKLQSTTQDWRVERFYEPAPLELDGQPIPRGFNVLQGSYTTFRNDLKQLPVGRRGTVELRIRRDNIPTGTPDEHLEYLVVTEPLPAGTTVSEKSVRGGFERFEISPGAITFYVGARRSISPIYYELHGYLPGEYRAAGTVVRNAYRPDQIALAKAKPLSVLPLGEVSKDKYRPTPRELYELGKRNFDKGNLKEAGPHLTELFAKWNLSSDYYKDTARMLLDVHLEQGPPREVVRYFEIVIEKYPELEIPFAKLVRAGDAYDKIGEYERSYLVFRGIVEGSFLRDSQVAGFLEGRGEFLRSVDVMAALLSEYPPEGYVASATYALAQRTLAKAPEAAADAKLREKKINRVDLVRRGLEMLGAFLTAHPEDPAADEAAFSFAGGLLELEAYEKAIEACRRYAKRYPKSEHLDNYWYVIGFCHFARGEHKEALAMCEKVAEARRRNRRSGRMEDSPNKWRAIYILGQIHHSLGEAAAAIEEYTRVKDRFVDARQAIEYFARKDIKLPEVSTIKPGASAEVELKFRNVASCDAKVYRIDLMKFGLLKRNLGGITKINLAGIRPHHEATIELGDGKDYRDRTKKLSMPLKEEGAYLIVCRGENLHTSGLVLVSPLAVEVQEEAESGRVRTTVRDAIRDKYVTDVHVKVIGSGNRDFISGETDLRGVFVADAIQGESTVIAQAGDGRYAFFRGQTHLGSPPAPEANAPAAPSDKASGKGKQKANEELLEGIKGGNFDIQQEQQKQLQDLYQNPNQGGFGGGGLF